VLVTGGGRGIGRGISELFASEGATIAVNYARDAGAAHETVSAITAAGGSAKAYQAAVEDPEQDEAMVDAVIGDFGRIDVLVHNAGVASRGRSVADTDPTEVARVVAVHAFGPHHLSRLVMPHMRKSERGDVVFISSVATNSHAANSAPYSMGKAAMESLAWVLAKEERKHNIHVNIVAPGLVDTDMGVRLAKAMGAPDIRMLDATMPFGRVCRPLDVARVVMYLCSEAAGYVTAQRIECDAGQAWR
jgi:3-oxoacyl-[acyl-carrier protein] reductase